MPELNKYERGLLLKWSREALARRLPNRLCRAAYGKSTHTFCERKLHHAGAHGATSVVITNDSIILKSNLIWNENKFLWRDLFSKQKRRVRHAVLTGVGLY